MIQLLANLRVLLVDDDAFLRRVVGQVLSGLGIKHLSMAEDGREALSFLNTHDIDLLITDVQMPRMNGLELIRQIRLGRAGIKPDLRTIVITSFSTMEVVIAGLALDINGFLVKPITPASAEKKIGIAMRERMSQREAEHYLSVDTELESIAQSVAGKTKKVTAAIARKEGERGADISAGSKIDLNQLKPGMRLMDDLNTKSGTTLITAGGELNEMRINRIKELADIIDSRQVRIL